MACTSAKVLPLLPRCSFCNEVPGLIDELPAIAALAAHAGQVTVHGAGELRVKESDRITTLVTGFRNLGIAAEEHADGFTTRGGGAPRGGVADAGGDHRMAMAFAIAALSAQQTSRIEGSDAVVISYPQFFDTLQNQDAGKWVLQQCDQVATALRSLTLPDVGTVLLSPTVVPSTQDGGFYGAGIRVRFTCEDVFTA